jgi:hypothetical protein
MSVSSRQNGGAGAGDERPPDAGAMLKETLRLYRANFLPFVLTVAALNAPLQLLTLLLNLTAPHIPPLTVSALLNLPSTQGSKVALTHPLTAAHIAAFVGIGARAVVGLILSSLVGVLTVAALSVVIARRRAGQPAGVGTAYRAVAARLGSLLAAFLWAALRFVVLFLLCPTIIGLVLFIYFLVAWALIPQAVMLEDSRGGAASGDSRRLVKGHWQRASNLFVFVVVLVLVVIGLPPAILAALLSHPLGLPAPLLQGLLGILIALFVQPLAAAATTVLYFDLKARKEASSDPAIARQAG